AEGCGVGLEALKSSREPSHHRPGAERDDEGDGSKEGGEHERAGALPRRQACNQASAMGERYRNGGPRRRPHPPAVTVAAGSGKRPAGSGQWLVGAAKQRQIGAQTRRQAINRLLLRLRRGIRRGGKLSDDFPRDLALGPEWTNARDERPNAAPP